MIRWDLLDSSNADTNISCAHVICIVVLPGIPIRGITGVELIAARDDFQLGELDQSVAEKSGNREKIRAGTNNRSNTIKKAREWNAYSMKTAGFLAGMV